jgi:hypothetical protein
LVKILMQINISRLLSVGLLPLDNLGQ